MQSKPRPKARDMVELGAVYAGHLICGRCLRAMRALRDSRGSVAYGCDRRTAGCSGGQVSIRTASPQLDADLESVLGSRKTLSQLLDTASQAAKREAAPTAAELGRRLALLENRRARVRDAYEAGTYDLAALRKREGAIDAERAGIEALMAVDEAWEPDTGLVDDLCAVFCGWSGLLPGERRKLLAAWRVEIVGRVEGPKRGRRVEVERVRLLGLPAHLWLYK